jgi:predicted transcriptional regulator
MVDADVSTRDAARLMVGQGIARLPVFDAQRLVGIVELADCREKSLGHGMFAATEAAP